jgi:hypothetical protein
MSIRSDARLKIISKSVTPEEVTARLGIKPDTCRHAGESRPHTAIIESTHCWELRSGLAEDRDLVEHITAVLARVEPCAARITELAEQNEVLLSCIVHAPSEPVLSLSKEIIARLASLGAEVDFDLYIGE